MSKGLRWATYYGGGVAVGATIFLHNGAIDQFVLSQYPIMTAKLANVYTGFKKVQFVESAFGFYNNVLDNEYIGVVAQIGHDCVVKPITKTFTGIRTGVNSALKKYMDSVTS